MRDAFAIERRYIRVSVVPLEGISEVNFSHYFPDVTTTSGEIVPALRRGNELVEIYVPYFPADTRKVINLKLFHTKSDSRPVQLRAIFNNQYLVDLIASNISETHGGQEFPIFSGKIKAVRGTNGSDEEKLFDNAILVDLVDPTYKEQKDRDANEQTRKTTDAPPPPILPAPGTM